MSCLLVKNNDAQRRRGMKLCESAIAEKLILTVVSLVVMVDDMPDESEVEPVSRIGRNTSHRLYIEGLVGV